MNLFFLIQKKMGLLTGFSILICWLWQHKVLKIQSGHLLYVELLTLPFICHFPIFFQRWKSI